MKGSFVGFLFVLLCGFTIGLVREVIFINSAMNWNDAQNYCRQNYRDLLTITTEEDYQMLINALGQNFTESWIGLYKSKKHSWLWSDGEVSSFDWTVFLLYKSLTGMQNCINIQKVGWDNEYCVKSLPFFCERTMILVQENKTWEEAYEYCTTQYTGLAFMNSAIQLMMANEETDAIQTDSVWTGLRFLAGKWFWVNGEPLGTLVSLPSCPAQPYRCGARNSETFAWENRDCEEKLNFLCY